MKAATDREPSARELRWFGLLFLGFWTVVGALLALRSREAAATVVVAASFVATALYYAVPGLRRPLLRGWLVATYPIGWAGSHLALGLFYFLVLGPLGVVMRAFGRDSLGRERRPGRDGYWSKAQIHGAKRYWNQF